VLGLELFGDDEPWLDFEEPDDEPCGAALGAEPEPERGAGATRGPEGDEVVGAATRGAERGVDGGAE
jgi:hypothetical protein